MDKFAVFGNPIAHSVSPRLHNLAIKELGLDAYYGRVLLDSGKNLKEKFLELGLKGANITVPFKLDAYEISEILSESAKEIGSVNTLVYKNSKFYGYNTDALGFYRAICEFGEIKNALIIGAGGTTRAMSYILHKNGIKFDILNRSKKEIPNLKCNNFYLHDNFQFSKYDLIINSTSAGLKDNLLPAPLEILKPIFSTAKFAFDAIYGKITPFLNLANSCELCTKDGANMLVGQAVLAFNLFYNSKFNENTIAKAMNKAINLI